MASVGLEEIWLDAYRTLTGWTWTDDVMLGNVDALLHRFDASHWKCSDSMSVLTVQASLHLRTHVCAASLL